MGSRLTQVPAQESDRGRRAGGVAWRHGAGEARGAVAGGGGARRALRRRVRLRGRSTGIYCRPSCPSRRPRRPHVTFFALPEAAERAGFRSCLRCRPRTVRVRDAQAERIQKVCRFVAEHLEEPLTLQRLGREAGLAPHHLQRTFKRVMGIEPARVRGMPAHGVFRSRGRKSRRDRRHLRSRIRIDAAASTSARRAAGHDARRLPKGGQGPPCATRSSTAAGPPAGGGDRSRGPLASLGDATAALERALRDEYPAVGDGARIDDALAGWLGAPPSSTCRGGSSHLAPCSTSAARTVFQRQVLQELWRIPRGEIAALRGRLLRAIGRPRPCGRWRAPASSTGRGT